MSDYLCDVHIIAHEACCTLLQTCDWDTMFRVHQRVKCEDESFYSIYYVLLVNQALYPYVLRVVFNIICHVDLSTENMCELN